MPDPGHVVEGIFVDPFPCERCATTAEEALEFYRDEMRRVAGRIEFANEALEYEVRMSPEKRYVIVRDSSLFGIQAKFIRSLSLEVGAGLPGVRG